MIHSTVCLPYLYFSLSIYLCLIVKSWSVQCTCNMNCGIETLSVHFYLSVCWNLMTSLGWRNPFGMVQSALWESGGAWWETTGHPLVSEKKNFDYIFMSINIGEYWWGAIGWLCNAHGTTPLTWAGVYNFNKYQAHFLLMQPAHNMIFILKHRM